MQDHGVQILSVQSILLVTANSSVKFANYFVYDQFYSSISGAHFMKFLPHDACCCSEQQYRSLDPDLTKLLSQKTNFLKSGR